MLAKTVSAILVPVKIMNHAILTKDMEDDVEGFGFGRLSVSL